MKTFRSNISGKEFPIAKKISGRLLKDNILTLIQKDVPGFTQDSFLSVSELKSYSEKHITYNLVEQTGIITDPEKKVLDSISADTILADIVEDEDKQPLTFGQRVADKVATFGGSWTFILSFLFFLLAWIATNVFVLANKGFDPYPFILLNLILSCIAALQAPIIMMSQNRQEEKDRDRAKKDYMINLKAELEIKALHDKIDHLIALQRSWHENTTATNGN